MKLLTTLVLLSVYIFYAYATPSCHVSELMQCDEFAMEWLYSLPKASIPETEKDFVVLCEVLRKEKTCVLKYISNCTTPLHKEVINLVLEGVYHLQDEFCKEGSTSRPKYLIHSACLNKVSQMEKVKEEIEYMLAVLEQARSVAMDGRITHTCCAYAKISNNLEKLAIEHCGRESIDAAKELFDFLLGQLQTILCGGFDGDSDECKAVLPPEGAKPSGSAEDSEIYKYVKKLFGNWLD